MQTLRDALHATEFTLTAELSIAPGASSSAVVSQARELAQLTDAVQIPDHSNAIPHMSNIAVAAHLVQNKIDPILQMNCRDRNRIAIQSDLLGAHSLGISNLLLMRGRKLPADHRPQTTSVFDMGAIDLIATAAAVRDGKVLTGGGVGQTANFFIGTVATAFSPPSEWEPEKLKTKADAGAQFVQLRICMDVDILRAYVARLVSAKLTWRFQVLAELAVIPSAEAARTLRNSMPDGIFPSDIVKRLKQATDPQQEGVDICAEHLQSLADIPGIAGATLMTPGDPATITAAIQAAGVRAGIPA